MAAEPYRVCIVCSGNICRSPIGEVVLRAKLDEAGLGDAVEVDSVGTGPWHVGEPADERARAVLAAHGYDGTTHQARQLDPEWLGRRDLMLALDAGHLRSLRHDAAETDAHPQIRLMREFDPQAVAAHTLEVADPYYDGAAEFEECLAQIERAADGVVTALEEHLR